MTGVTIVLLVLGVGIIVGIVSKKLTLLEFLVCGIFGMLLAATPPGVTINAFVVDTIGALVPWIAGWLS